jgi:rubrerythrin
MDIFDFAINMEKEGQAFYLELAQKSHNQGLKNIFKMLAADEEKHGQILVTMREETAPELTETAILNQAKGIFAGLTGEELEIGDSTGQIDLYLKALDIEKRSEDFYRSKAQEINNEPQKELLLKIAEEESRHRFLLQNIIEFVSRPQQWIEDAEFNHLEDY